MQYIYVRVSTNKQDNENQALKLKEQYPHAALFEEIASGAKERPILTKLLSILAQGDVLIVGSLDRLGRKTSEVLRLIEDLERKGIILKSIREGVDYSTITGKLVTQILCSVSELERNLISERTKQALAAKRLKGIVGGRKPTISPERVEQAMKLRSEGHTFKAISKATGISEARIYQLWKKSRKGDKSDIPPQGDAA